MRSLLLSILIAGQAAFPCAVIATPTTPTSRGPEASAAQGAKSISQYEGRKRERRTGERNKAAYAAGYGWQAGTEGGAERRGPQLTGIRPAMEVAHSNFLERLAVWIACNSALYVAPSSTFACPPEKRCSRNAASGREAGKTICGPMKPSGILRSVITKGSPYGLLF